MKKIFTLFVAVLASLSMMAAIAPTMPTTTLSLPGTDAIDAAKWSKTEKFYYYANDTLVVHAYDAYQSRSLQTWTSCNDKGSTSGTWNATGCFKGSAYYGTNGGNVAKTKLTRAYTYRVSNCKGALAYVKTQNSREVVIEAYEIAADTAVATPVATASDNSNATAVISINGLDTAKSYVIAVYGNNSSDAGVIYEVAFACGHTTPVVKYTVSYFDGDSLLGTESVKENELPTKYASYQVKAHNVFDGWFNDAALTSAADFTAAITADKSFYGKWTAESYQASSSINIEQAVLDNGVKYDFASALAAAHITAVGMDALDSLNDTKTARNEPYLGLKMKLASSYVEIGLNAGDVLRLKLGNIGAAVKVTAAGLDSTLATTAEKVFEYTATAQGYVKVANTAAKTVVLKQIMINQPIADVVLPDSPLPTALDEAAAEMQVVKFIENGKLFILKNGVKYDAAGSIVK